MLASFKSCSTKESRVAPLALRTFDMDRGTVGLILGRAPGLRRPRVREPNRPKDAWASQRDPVHSLVPSRNAAV